MFDPMFSYNGDYNTLEFLALIIAVHLFHDLGIDVSGMIFKNTKWILRKSLGE